jgi:hypothetical protein
VILFSVYGYFHISIKNEGALRHTGFVDRDGMDKALNYEFLASHKEHAIPYGAIC